ncbi:hypothetical protein PI124_g19203 [Phytophthora idaei]|nr:hypothetical protein PI124_g19203 [Phytophthora idaei]
MRSLLLIVFSTLVVLLATTGAVSPNVPNLEPATKKSGYASTSQVHSLPAEYNVDDKRRLRGDDNSMGMEKFNTDDEDRASIISRIVAQAKQYYLFMRVGINPHIQSKSVMRLEDEWFNTLYQSGVTPVMAIIAKMGHKNSIAPRYKAWYDKKLAANNLAPN